MPILDGPRATILIRNLLSDRGISREDQPFICCISAYSEKNFQDKAIEAGMDYFLTKPIFKDNLSQLMMQVSHSQK